MLLIQMILCLGVGAWLMFELFRALRTGEGRGRFLSFKRGEDPALYWLVILAQASLATMCFWLTVDAVRSLLH
jgi:hypothetical protein